jgi:hypothetical protein
MHDYIAFLDECGNNGLYFTKKGVSTHFIVAALTLQKAHIGEAKTHVEVVRMKFFQNGPIKSAKVSSDYKRRLATNGNVDILDQENYAILR